MDINRFDHIAKLLARTPSRRGAVSALAGAAVVALLPIRRRAAAACGAGGAPCDAGTPCCDAFTCCGGRCANLKASERHCGTCGNRCRSDQRCSYDEERGEARCCPKGRVFCGGRCIVCDGLNRACADGACGCAEWAERCDGRCFNLEQSQQHCGTCGNACLDQDHCSYGHCCPENREWCERDGRCVFRICDGQDGHHGYNPEDCLCEL